MVGIFSFQNQYIIWRLIGKGRLLTILIGKTQMCFHFQKKIQSNIDDVIILLNTQKTAERLFTLHSHFITHNKIHYTGGPPLTGKTPTRFPLPRFLAYVRVSGGTSVSRGPQYSPTNTNFM